VLAARGGDSNRYHISVMDGFPSCPLPFSRGDRAQGKWTNWPGRCYDLTWARWQWGWWSRDYDCEWILIEEVAWVDYEEKELSRLPRRWEVHVYIGHVITPRSDRGDHDHQCLALFPVILRLVPSNPVPASLAPVLFEVPLSKQYFPLGGLVTSRSCLVVLSTPNRRWVAQHAVGAETFSGGWRKSEAGRH